MKLFINKCFFLTLTVTALFACSSKEQPEQPPVVEETIVVEETVLPPTAQTLPLETTPKPLPQATAAKEPDHQGIVNLKAWDKKLKFLNTRFEQTTQYDGVPVSKSQGLLYYDKDKNLLRLDTLDTDGHTDQTAVTDKQKILILDGKGKEITTLSWQEWQQGQPNQALFDFGNYTALLKRHEVVAKEPLLLELTPKEGEKYTLYITLDKQDYFPTDIKIVSDLLVTEAKLFDTKKNQTLAFDTFRAGGLFK